MPPVSLKNIEGNAKMQTAKIVWTMILVIKGLAANPFRPRNGETKAHLGLPY